MHREEGIWLGVAQPGEAEDAQGAGGPAESYDRAAANEALQNHGLLSARIGPAGFRPITQSHVMRLLRVLG